MLCFYVSKLYIIDTGSKTTGNHIGNRHCYRGMFDGCTGLSLTTTKDADRTLAWSLADATEELNWNAIMFEGCPNVDPREMALRNHR